MADVLILGAGLAGLRCARGVVLGADIVTSSEAILCGVWPQRDDSVADRWVAGSLECAVRTGRSAARAALSA